MTDFLYEAQSLLEYTRNLRRDFHMYPELGFQEFRTSGIVADELRKLGLETFTGIGKTGVVAILEGEKPGPVILVRADMDALPIVEATGAPYSSKITGNMHACGHDAHTAILLTVARMLSAHPAKLSGTIKFVFQPAEEGLGGAESLIDAGVLENPAVDCALALHLWNEKPTGWIGISTGPSMAGGEIFKVKVIGKGGHGAAPHLAVDPILAASQIIVALQGITARNVPPLQSAVISVCTIHGGEAFNVIPSEVEITGTIRTFEPTVRSQVLERFEQTIRSIAQAMGCSVDIDIKRLTPAVINNPSIAAKVQEIARSLFPKAIIDTSNYVTMGSEDMAYIMEKVPGCFFFIGSANNKKGLIASHHHPQFDIDEDVLPHAAALMAEAIVNINKSGIT